MADRKHRHQLTRQQRRSLRRNKAAQASRERKAGRPWQRALETVRQLVDGGMLPPGCARVIEAMGRCHLEHGTGIQDRELLIGYGDRGDPRRVAARTTSRTPPPVHVGIAEEAGLSRRWAIACVLILVQAGVLRRWYGGPRADYRENVRPQVDARTRERREQMQGVGGTGWANGYTVEGIPDPLPDEPPSPASRPDEPPPGERQNLEPWRRIRQQQEEARLEGLRRRAGEVARGP